MQHEITSSGPLLNERGQLNEPGWSRKQLPIYNRSDIKASKFLIKEWDYYLVGNDAFSLALTVADNGYMGMISASLMEYNKASEITKSYMNFFTLGRNNLPPRSSSGVTKETHKNSEITFTVKDGVRTLHADIKDFKDGFPLKADITLADEPDESMVIATPFPKKDTAFYYNQKILCMRASGKVKYRGSNYMFSPINSYGLLDWGRGVWTYENTWYWGAAQTYLDGKSFGFNIGYGFGDTSAATENVILYDGKIHKLDQISFNIPSHNGRDDFLSPWTFTSNDGRFEMDFTPILDRAADTNFLVLQSDQHQVFGKYNGTVVLDDGTVLKVRNLIGFAEKVYNRW